MSLLWQLVLWETHLLTDGCISSKDIGVLQHGLVGGVVGTNLQYTSPLGKLGTVFLVLGTSLRQAIQTWPKTNQILAPAKPLTFVFARLLLKLSVSCSITLTIKLFKQLCLTENISCLWNDNSSMFEKSVSIQLLTSSESLISTNLHQHVNNPYSIPVLLYLHFVFFH